MKAVVLEKHGKISIRKLDDPEISDDRVLVKIGMCGFCGTDLLNYNLLLLHSRLAL